MFGNILRKVMSIIMIIRWNVRMKRMVGLLLLLLLLFMLLFDMVERRGSSGSERKARTARWLIVLGLARDG